MARKKTVQKKQEIGSVLTCMKCGKDVSTDEIKCVQTTEGSELTHDGCVAIASEPLRPSRSSVESEAGTVAPCGPSETPSDQSAPSVVEPPLNWNDAIQKLNSIQEASDALIRRITGRSTTLIHTYFEPTELNYEEELRLLLLWQHRWQSLGYETRVLNESHALRHPLYADYLRKVDAFPSVNPRDYERACWLRWLAFETIGAGFMADYDCFCRHACKDGPVAFNVYEEHPLIVYEGHRDNACPSLVSATQAGVRKFVEWILTTPDGYSPTIPGAGQPMNHFSDMLAIREFPELLTISLVKQYGEHNWLNAWFVHCSHASTHPNGKMPRYKFVRQIMEEKA